MCAEAVRSFGTVHILVANAGIQRDSPFAEMSLEDWRRVLDVNLTGQFLCAREAVREFLRRGPEPEVSAATGKILCMSPVHHVIPWAVHSNYVASMGGTLRLRQTLDQAAAPATARGNPLPPR